MMTLRLLRTPAVSASMLSMVGAMLLAVPAFSQAKPVAEPASPYGGATVEEIIARVNDQIITRSDYDRAMKELDDEGRQRGMTMQQLSEAHKDLLRNLVDQQLWLSKGKELGVTGDTELVNRLNEIRKQYNLGSMDDLAKAAQEQGVSFEDFKANIRNQIITQQVMRDEVGRRINVTPGEAQRYFEEHKQDYVQPESVHLNEILVSTGTGDADEAKTAAAKAKADDIEAKLKGGADFAQLARTSSDGQTAGEGGELGEYKRGALAKVLEDATFGLNAGQYTEPIRTRQGYVILKVTQHHTGGAPEFKDVQGQVEEAYYMTKMEPAMREYLTKMREDSYVTIKPGYDDTGATTNKRINPIAYSTYTPPAPKKKKKVERTRFRENAHFREKSPQVVNVSATTTTTTPAAAKKTTQAAEKPGKKEKIRFGKAPTKTLPTAATATPTEDANGASGATAATATAGTQVAQNTEPDNPLEQAAPQKKSRFSERAKQPKQPKPTATSLKDAQTPAPAEASEVADRQTQSQPLGLGGATDAKKKKDNATTGEKTRFSQRKPDDAQKSGEPAQPTPIPQAQGAPAAQQPPAQAPAPAPQPQTPAPQPQQ
ncbi:peptidylprolyl isomerase [Terracidiphilus gabretensis]|uniref:peptidylprolyl isomerase n=1 Tax=Terracidiphilus gabretensis TaxID=1577687 RepID=UPI0018D1FA02|nr:peptidylprolyl isomerase [Terracidiphilus gabretensis]